MVYGAGLIFFYRPINIRWVIWPIAHKPFASPEHFLVPTAFFRKKRCSNSQEGEGQNYGEPCNNIRGNCVTSVNHMWIEFAWRISLYLLYLLLE